MDRRLLITALAGWPFAPALAQEEARRPRHKISAGELHTGLATRFPLRLSLGGFVDLRVSAPALLLLPARNRLGATLLVQVSGRQLQQAPPGEADVVFALRYEASDQTVRAHSMEILDLRWPGLAPEMLAVLQRTLPQVARETVAEFVLHKFTPRELALADTMGFEPGTMTVVDDGLLVVFAPKPRR
jgi:hypothetical protein